MRFILLFYDECLLNRIYGTFIFIHYNIKYNKEEIMIKTRK